MGEIADDVIAGFQCSHCGVCFKAEHSYPVLCKDCFEDETPAERAGLPKAIEKEIGES